MSKKKKIEAAKRRYEVVRQMAELEDNIKESGEMLWHTYGLLYQKAVQTLDRTMQKEESDEKKREIASLTKNINNIKDILMENHRISYIYLPADLIQEKTIHGGDEYNPRDLMEFKDEHFAPGTVMWFKDEFLEEKTGVTEIKYPFAVYDGFDSYVYNKERGSINRVLRFKLIKQDVEPDFNNLETCQYDLPFITSEIDPTYHSRKMLYGIKVNADKIVTPVYDCEVEEKKVDDWVVTPYFYMGSDADWRHCKGTIVRFYDIDCLKVIFADYIKHKIIDDIKYPYAIFDFDDVRRKEDGTISMKLPNFKLIAQDREPHLDNLQRNLFVHNFQITDIYLSKVCQIIYDVKAKEPHYRRVLPFDVPYWWVYVLVCIAVMLGSLLFNPLRIPVCIGAPILLIGWWVKEYRKLVKRLKDNIFFS